MTNESFGKANPGWRPATLRVRGGLERSSFKETSESIIATSGYIYDRAEDAEAMFLQELDGFQYSRIRNPSVAMFEQRMVQLEGVDAGRATASGMAAVAAAFLAQVKAGDHVVAGEGLFGSCKVVVSEILPRLGVECTLVPNTDLEAWKAAVRPETTLFFLESPTNPTLEVSDLAAISDIAHESGAQVILDNVFATPVLQHAPDFGIDIIVYSATKHIDGQGRCLGGIVLGKKEFVDDLLDPYLRNTGPSLSPFNAWVLLKGIETLDLRVRAQSAAAAKVADFLADQKQVNYVLYPGRKDHPQHDLAMKQMSNCGGTLVSFDVPGGKDAAFGFLNALNLVDISNNLGDTKSLITHPVSTTHYRLTDEERARLGIGDGLLRLSVGLEDVADITEDLAQALEKAGN